MFDNIFAGISQFFNNLFLGFLNLLPNLDFVIPGNVVDSVCDFVSAASYLLPIKLLMPIVVFSFALATFRFVWAIILRIKSFIPTMGD